MPDLKEKLVELIDEKQIWGIDQEQPRKHDIMLLENEELADHLLANGVTIQECARPLEKWNEDYGDALWWKFPIEEPPYVGSPLDMSWPGYHTHWTLIPMPQPPKGE